MMSRNFSIGLSLGYNWLSIKGYGSSGDIIPGFAMQYSLENKFVLDLSLINPISKLELGAIANGSSMSWSLYYRYRENIDWFIRVSKVMYFLPTYRWGIIVRPAANTSLRLGMGYQPIMFGLDCSFRISKEGTGTLIIEMLTNLGWSPSAGLVFPF